MGGRVSCWLLLTLSLKGVLAGDWSVSLPSNPISAVIGSSVVLPCSYDFPSSEAEGRLSAQEEEEEEEEEERDNSTTFRLRSGVSKTVAVSHQGLVEDAKNIRKHFCKNL
ncbi:hypothetical protein F7725_018815 [Dissostichus mawsoni]|uniref:Uncharacterized protein n=1 Tax=Dissostichus mawsoni TaxID=36200 RepID=A0A7J5XVD5_DISMA|nr:hypothetical protein F7725_018815 [Dissostichus mawsoni]